MTSPNAAAVEGVERKHRRIGESAFPIGDSGGAIDTGLTVREYFAAHAPAPQDWFHPKLNEAEVRSLDPFAGKYRSIVARETAAQWPWAWADAVLKAGTP